MPYYRLYGLNVSSNQPIPGLVPQTNSGESHSQVHIWLGAMPEWMDKTLDGRQTATEWYVSKYQDENGMPLMRVSKLNSEADFWLRYSDGTEFVLDLQGNQIWATWSDNLTLEDTATYLLGPVLGWLLRLRQVTCLHASAIAVDNQAIALVGSAGAGKSTTAAAFAKLGYPVLSDDVVALVEQGDRFLVQPAYPRLRLWSESVCALYNAPDALPRIVPTHPTWDKRYLDLTQDGYQFQQQPLPLAAIYLLGARSSDPAAPYCQAVCPHKRVISLVANTYANNLLDKATRASEFELLSRLVKNVPLLQVIPSADVARMMKLCETILADFHS